MLFLSQLVGRPVRDRSGEPFGKVRDLIVALGERYPPVTGLVLRVAGGREIFLPWSDVEEVDTSGARLSASSIDITSYQQRPNEIRLWLDLQDKQIVDVEGRKIVRVNDIQLAPVRGRLRLVAVDVGLAGILRRLGLSGPGERLSKALGIETENYIEWEDVDPVESSVSSLKLRVPHQALYTLHPADVAHIVEQLAPRDRAGILAALDDERAADVLEELGADDQVDVLEALPPERAADILEEMGPDEAADLVADLSEERQAELLALMEPEEASDVRQLLTYGEETAGGLMTTDFITLSADQTAGDVIDMLRRLAPLGGPGLLPLRDRCRWRAHRHRHAARSDRGRPRDAGPRLPAARSDRRHRRHRRRRGGTRDRPLQPARPAGCRCRRPSAGDRDRRRRARARAGRGLA